MNTYSAIQTLQAQMEDVQTRLAELELWASTIWSEEEEEEFIDFTPEPETFGTETGRFTPSPEEAERLRPREIEEEGPDPGIEMQDDEDEGPWASRDEGVAF